MNTTNLDIKNFVKVKRLLDSILHETQNEKNNRYLTITNSDGKAWVLTDNNLSTAMNIYQPSSVKGKLLKKFLPLLNSIPIIATIFERKLGITEKFYEISPQLMKLLKSVFNVDELELSFFLGTPSVHQKTTMQVFSGNRILGYCKITNRNEIKKVFKHEEEVLTYFNKVGIENIPKCLYCGSINVTTEEKTVAIDDMWLFIQSTIKTKKSKVKHNIIKEHYEFLLKLAELTKIDISYLESDYNSMVEGLKVNVDYLINYGEVDLIESKRIIMESINIVEKELRKSGQRFSGYHSDFTPWNMFFEPSAKDSNDGGLFVFDFEYAKFSYPPLLDIFHYFTQICIFEKQMGPEEIYQKFLDDFKVTKSLIGDNVSGWKNVDDYKKSYMYYLLDVIALYLDRDQGQFNRDVKRNLSIWIKLLGKLLKDIEIK